MRKMEDIKQAKERPAEEIIHFNKEEIAAALIKVMAAEKEFEDAMAGFCNVLRRNCNPRGMVNTKI